MARLRDSGRLSRSTAALSGNPTRLLQPETVSPAWSTVPNSEWAAEREGSRAPVGRDAPVIMHLLLTGAVRPDLAINKHTRSAPELLLRDVGPITAQTRVVPKLVPRNGVLVRADRQKSTERHDGVGDAAAHLLDHQPLDGANVLPVRIVDGRAFHPVTLDPRLGRRWLLDRSSSDEDEAIGSYASRDHLSCGRV